MLLSTQLCTDVAWKQHIHRFLSLLCSPALSLTCSPSPFSLCDTILAAIQLPLRFLCISLTFVMSWHSQQKSVSQWRDVDFRGQPYFRAIDFFAFFVLFLDDICILWSFFQLTPLIKTMWTHEIGLCKFQCKCYIFSLKLNRWSRETTSNFYLINSCLTQFHLIKCNTFHHYQFIYLLVWVSLKSFTLQIL